MATNQELIALIGQFENEHVEVREALAKIDTGIDARDSAAVKSALASGSGVLRAGLDEHSSTEDNELFPRIAEFLGQGMVGVFAAEHIQILELRDQIYSNLEVGVADFEGCASFLELLSSHIDREDAMLFPASRGVLAD